MLIPSAMFIEIAREELRKETVRTTATKRKELHIAAGAQSEEFIAGYLLGIKTKEVLDEMMPGQKKADS